jgi:mRNA-degrading endonuclease RelE of RelBE toxin-antitoxin system
MDKIEKLLKELLPKYRERLLKTIFLIINGQTDFLDVKKISGRNNFYRVRCGLYRIIYQKNNDKNIILDIRKRDDNTYHQI